MTEVPRLAEMRLDALEARIDADLHLGRHREVIAELQALTAAEPLRERLHELLMLALYRSGQQAAALAAYRQARRHLVEEIGIEPGPGLRELNQQILHADRALLATGPRRGRGPARGRARRRAADGSKPAGLDRPAVLPAAVADSPAGPGSCGRCRRGRAGPPGRS